MRPIDAVALSEGIELHRQPTDQKYEMDRQWAVGYNAGLDRALHSIAYAKTIAPPPNDPLTLEELRQMDGEPVWVVTGSAINAGRGHWDICDWWDKNTVMFPYSGEQPRIDDCGITWLAYRRRPEGG